MFWFAPMLCLENHESVSGGEAMFHTPQLAGISHLFSGRRIAKFGALAVLAQLIAGSIARGQATTSIRGTVTDGSGGYVGGASVTLTNPESRSHVRRRQEIRAVINFYFCLRELTHST